MISQISTAQSKDLATVEKCLLDAELALAEAYTAVLKLKESNQIIDDRIITHVADSWHYSTEAIRLIEATNETLLPNLRQANATSASAQS
ncbi:hypothetical protein H6G33_36505 [Calothrix sp. FACHB-1219]|uniref:hypothetical protein n=1 Tax=unclassified Calothrix TaxID=2619626 RepID=UPI001688966C|nr:MULTISPECIES: hypothetical protein [unclassified Calothrix]MBD2207829.1 hypothetical protein [Calothrix sp. FACHB-168]MBD2222435.1 hypothetical protein [Calothrix sp. FACHB-1219]